MSPHRRFSRIVAWQKHDFHPSSPQGAFKLQHKITGEPHQPRDTRRDLQEQPLPKSNDRIQQLVIQHTPVQTTDPKRHILTFNKFISLLTFFFFFFSEVHHPQHSTWHYINLITFIYTSTPWREYWCTACTNVNGKVQKCGILATIKLLNLFRFRTYLKLFLTDLVQSQTIEKIIVSASSENWSKTIVLRNIPIKFDR